VFQRVWEVKNLTIIHNWLQETHNTYTKKTETITDQAKQEQLSQQYFARIDHIWGSHPWISQLYSPEGFLLSLIFLQIVNCNKPLLLWYLTFKTWNQQCPTILSGVISSRQQPWTAPRQTSTSKIKVSTTSLESHNSGNKFALWFVFRSTPLRL
jgi:hypothetical protein